MDIRMHIFLFFVAPAELYVRALGFLLGVDVQSEVLNDFPR